MLGPLMRRRRVAGLTLLELAITLAVLVVLGALALPSLGARMEHHRLRGAAEALAADITEARFEAARRGQALHLLAIPGPAWCWAITTAPGCDCSQAQICQLHAVHVADHARVRLLTAQALQMEPSGVVVGELSSTFESPRGERLRVEVSPLGRPRLCSEVGSWPNIGKC
jgi:type IV fimbrial biogenesis protein FimT